MQGIIARFRSAETTAGKKIEEEEEAVAPLGSGEGATKPEEEKKERKQSTSRSEDERGSPRARSKDEACGVYEKQTKRERIRRTV